MSQNVVLDLHLHSRFSRAVSQSITLPNLYLWGKLKGIHILSASDVTHPAWFAEIESQLIEQSEGVYALKNAQDIEKDHAQYFRHNSFNPRFILTTELSLIYSEFGKGRRVHVIVCFPSIEVVKKVSKQFLFHDFNLISDGRPILGISLKNLCELLFTIDSRIVVIPAHAWTPWFGVYGSKSGYDSLEEAFGEYASHIFAIESGLSSDPLMNWQVKELENRSIVSFSDAHSLSKIGRELTVLKVKDKHKKISQDALTYDAIIHGMRRDSEKSNLELAYTVEYYPEEGKYHHTGHRNCRVSFTPSQTREQGIMCPVCGKALTVGVLHRIESLKQTEEVDVTESVDAQGVTWMQNRTRGKYVNIVQLLEVIAESSGVGVNSKKVKTIYFQLLENLGSELTILLENPIADISRTAGEKIGEAILKVRKRDIVISPGFDGEYGKVAIWKEGETSNGEQLKMI